MNEHRETDRVTEAVVRAVVCRGVGPSDATAFEAVADPVPATGQVRVGVEAIGVNFVDLLMLEGLYQFKPPLPFIPGLEAAGVIEDVGPETDAPPVGTRVMVQARLGAYATKMVVATDALMRTPPGFDAIEAAAVQVGFATAYNALVERAGLRAGENLLVLGAGGGVGLAAVELGALMGANVIAVASSSEKLEAARRRGAAAGVLAAEGGFRDAVRRVAPDGVDVVFDPVGGAAFEQSLRCLAYGARILVVGFAAGIGTVQANRILIKGATVLGVRAGEAVRRDPAQRLRMRAALRAWADRGGLKPHVSHVLPLERWRDAHGLLRARQSVGRIVLVTH